MKTTKISTCSPYWLLNRIWRKKFLLMTFILIFLIITITLSNSKINAFSTLFAHEKNIDNSRNNLPRSLVPPQKLINDQDNPYVPEIKSREEQINGAKPFSERSYIQVPMKPKIIGYVPNHRFVHLDLKGAPPKISYFKELFPLLAKAGANGLLIEYEDTFPYEGDLRYAVMDIAYSKDQVKEIKQLALANNLEVIPLVQTLGHLEFFLKLERYRNLREVDEFPQAICPSRNASFELLTNMIDQMLAVHPESKWIHIGCDEVYQIGSCDLCTGHMREDLFLGHVKKIASYIKNKYGINSIIWDDMLRQIPPDMIRSYELDKEGVELMIWTYVDDIYRFIPPMTWSAFAESFPKIWGASAFKGAFGETLTVPNVKWHLDNNIAWLRTFEEQKNEIKNIQGLVLTGWQRYDHLANLCELLPSGLPSLIISLLTVSHGKYEHQLWKNYSRLMRCQQQDINENILTHDQNLFTLYCSFPGSNIFDLMREFQRINKAVDDYLYDVTIHKAWLTDYNVRHNITSPWRINEGLHEYVSIDYQVKYILRKALQYLSEVYDQSTVYEWIEQKIYPQMIRLERFYNRTMQLKQLRVWPKRPIKPAEDLMRIIKQSGNYETPT